MFQAVFLLYCATVSQAVDNEIRVGGFAKEYSWYNLQAVTPPQDQGQCEGASMCFAGVTIYETEFYRETAQLPNLSVQVCLECSIDAGCEVEAVSHSNMEKVLQWLRHNGSPNQTDYPFTAGSMSSGKPKTNIIGSSTTVCQAKKVKCSNKVHLHKKHKAGKSTLKHWIAKNPCACLMYGDETFRSYTGTMSNSTYQCSKNNPSDKELNHAVAAIGYDKNTNYIIQNSYGTSWGDQGYAILKKGKECGLRKRIFRYNWYDRLHGVLLLLLISLIFC